MFQKHNLYAIWFFTIQFIQANFVKATECVLSDNIWALAHFEAPFCHFPACVCDFAASHLCYIHPPIRIYAGV